MFFGHNRIKLKFTNKKISNKISLLWKQKSQILEIKREIMWKIVKYLDFKDKMYMTARWYLEENFDLYKHKYF